MQTPPQAFSVRLGTQKKVTAGIGSALDMGLEIT